MGGVRLCGRSPCGRVPDLKALFAVSFQHVGKAEALAAGLARVRLLAGVRAPVSLHVGTTGEALPADLADVRLLAWDTQSGQEALVRVCMLSSSHIKHDEAKKKI